VLVFGAQGGGVAVGGDWVQVVFDICQSKQRDRLTFRQCAHMIDEHGIAGMRHGASPVNLNQKQQEESLLLGHVDIEL